ncbi:hypothetical protein OsJ_17451 [Oryza sativa Japonica Group]|uniref:Germin-like protein n=1 Tax=Oryza sativa subsp. japonica TaxID=39947 RepID=B9FIK4_ORYSJ|nr:hypothetical protein OsJ_17451 [Oryza sativa Japonica Group]
MAMVGRSLLLLLLLVTLAAGHGVVVVVAFDPNPLQDFCVADPTSKVRVNGLPCKDPAAVTADDFFFSGVGEPAAGGGRGATASPAVRVHGAVGGHPGANTLGASAAPRRRGPGGVFRRTTTRGRRRRRWCSPAPSTSASSRRTPDSRVVAKVLRRGDVFAVPQGLVHFLHNNGSEPAALYASLSSQNPGLVLVADALLAAPLPVDLVAKTLLTDEATVDKIRANFIVHRS